MPNATTTLGSKGKNHKNRLLDIAVETGKLDEQDRHLILAAQRGGKIRTEPSRVGDLALLLGLLDERNRDDLLKEQTERRDREGSSRLRPASPASALRRQAFLALVILALFAIAVFGLGIRPDIAATFGGFLGYLGATLIQYLSEGEDRSLIVALWGVTKGFVFVVLLMLIVTGANAIMNLDLSVPRSQPQVVSWLRNTKLAFLALAVIAGMVGAYGCWKHASLRFAEGRFGVFKDLILHVEKRLANQNEPLGIRQQEATCFVLKSMAKILGLNPRDRVIQRFRPDACASTVLFLRPDLSNKRFNIVEAVYPEQAPERVTQAFEWFKHHHHPRFFAEAEFNELVHLARGKNPAEWESRFLNFKERHEFISVCGLVFHEKRPIFRDNAEQFYAFDSSYVDQLLNQGYSKGELKWLTFRSFVACPVFGDEASNQEGDPLGVLVVLKNHKNGLVPEDLEAVTWGAHLLKRILK